MNSPIIATSDCVIDKLHIKKLNIGNIVNYRLPIKGNGLIKD